MKLSKFEILSYFNRNGTELTLAICGNNNGPRGHSGGIIMNNLYSEENSQLSIQTKYYQHKKKHTHLKIEINITVNIISMGNIS